MKYWTGDREIVIGTVDDHGNVDKEFRIQPGEEIPPEALELIKAANQRGDGVTSIPYFDDGYDRDLVKRTMRIEE